MFFYGSRLVMISMLLKAALWCCDESSVAPDQPGSGTEETSTCPLVISNGGPHLSQRRFLDQLTRNRLLLPKSFFERRLAHAPVTSEEKSSSHGCRGLIILSIHLAPLQLAIAVSSLATMPSFIAKRAKISSTMFSLVCCSTNLDVKHDF